jgi:hypothetical protein
MKIGRLCGMHVGRVLKDLDHSRVSDVSMLVALEFFTEIDPDEFHGSLQELVDDLEDKAAGCPCCYLGTIGDMILTKSIGCVEREFV